VNPNVRKEEIKEEERGEKGRGMVD